MICQLFWYTMLYTFNRYFFGLYFSATSLKRENGESRNLFEAVIFRSTSQLLSPCEKSMD